VSYRAQAVLSGRVPIADPIGRSPGFGELNESRRGAAVAALDAARDPRHGTAIPECAPRTASASPHASATGRSIFFRVTPRIG